MRNGIKRILILFLAVILAAGSFCVSRSVRAQGVEQEKEQMDDLEEQSEQTQNMSGSDNLSEYDIWMAQTMIHGFENTGNGLYPMFQGFSDPVYKQLGEYLLEDKLQVVLSSSWSIYFNSEYRNQFANEQKYIYEIFLMGFLKYEAESSSIAIELENSETKFSVKLLELLEDLLGDTIKNKDDYIKNMSSEEAAGFFKKVTDNYAGIKDLNNSISEVKDFVDNGKELIDAVSEYLTLKQAKEERVSLIKAARDACADSDSPNSDFIKAADDIIKALKSSVPEYVVGKSLDYAWKQCLDTGWDAFCESDPVLKGIDLGVSGLNACFNTEEKASDNLKLAILYIVDCYMKLGMMNAASDFMGSDTEINGQSFITCFQAYAQFQMYGNDFAKTWLKDYLDGGLLADAINNLFYSENITTANDLISLSDSQTANRKKLLELIDKYSDIYWKLKKKEEEKDVVRDVVLVLDRSGSMDGEPMDQTKEAALNFLDTVFEQEEASRVAIVTYDSQSYVNCGLTTNKPELTSCIENIYAGDTTNMYSGLQEADRMLQESTIEKKIIVLMSDGLPNEGVSDSSGYSEPLLQFAAEMKSNGYYIYTLGFFMSVDSSEIYNAQQLMEGIASPGLHYEVESADDLVFFFEDIANQISGTRYVHIRIACPVDVTVKSGEDVLSSKADAESKRAPFGTLTYETIQDEDENGNISEDRVKILRLNMEKDYDVEIEGYGTGTMDYTVSFPNESGEYDDVRSFPGIEVTETTKAASNTGAADATYLEVDKDGDGKADITYKTEANGKMEEVKDDTVLYIVLIVTAVFVILILILVIVLIRVSGKKKNSGQGGNITGEICGAFGIYQGKSYPIGPGGKCIVGRKTSCDIQLVHGQVSRVHCIIEMLPDGVYQVTDYSSNGTFYNDQKLKNKQPYRLPKGALLAIGDADNILELK